MAEDRKSSLGFQKIEWCLRPLSHVQSSSPPPSVSALRSPKLQKLAQVQSTGAHAVGVGPEFYKSV